MAAAGKTSDSLIPVVRMHAFQHGCPQQGFRRDAQHAKARASHINEPTVRRQHGDDVAGAGHQGMNIPLKTPHRTPFRIATPVQNSKTPIR